MLVGILGGPRWSFTVHGPEEFDKAPMLHLAGEGAARSLRCRDQFLWPEPALSPPRGGGMAKVPRDPTAASTRLFSTPPPRPSLRRLDLCVLGDYASRGPASPHRGGAPADGGGVEFELVLAGDGELRLQIETRIADYGLTGRVRITGWLSSAEVREEISPRARWRYRALPRGFPSSSWKPWRSAARSSAHTWRGYRSW